MTNCQRTLLPDNATEFELHLETMIRGKYCRIDSNIINKLSDPWLCPEEFLPWLANAARVTHWDDSLTVDNKRKLIASAPEVNELKGTDQGLQDALDALGIQIEIIHWHQMNPQGVPGTMDLKIKAAENFSPDTPTLINQRMIRLINDIVETHKRFSIHHVISLGVSFTMGLKLAFTGQFRAMMILGAIE